MIMADDRGTIFASCPMRGDQYRRVEFEMARWIGCDIGGWRDRVDPTGPAQQQAAYFMIISRRQGHDLFQQHA